jgi:hypothetical protein
MPSLDCCCSSLPVCDGPALRGAAIVLSIHKGGSRTQLPQPGSFLPAAGCIGQRAGRAMAAGPCATSPVSPGSLVKPFLAIAYGEQHGGRFPTVRCLGTGSRCWLPRGHGNLGLEEAIAQSCNAYFLELAAGLDRQRAAQTFARYGLAGPAHRPQQRAWRDWEARGKSRRWPGQSLPATGQQNSNRPRRAGL